MVDRLAAVFKANARLLKPAKRQLNRRDVVGVDPACARIQRGDHPVPAHQIAGKNARRQTIFGIIRARDGLFLGIKRQHGHHRAKDFLLHNRHVVGAFDENRRRNKVSIGGHAPMVFGGHAHTASQHLRAASFALLDVAHHFGEMLGRDHRAHLRRRVHRVAQPDRLGPCFQFGKERLQHAALNKHPRPV